MEPKNDPENYLLMSEPFESSDKANEAVSEFQKGIEELRKKHKIRDVLLVVNDSVKYSDGNIGEFMAHFSFGSALKRNVMAAYLYGQTSAEERERINKLLAGNKEL